MIPAILGSTLSSSSSALVHVPLKRMLVLTLFHSLSGACLLVFRETVMPGPPHESHNTLSHKVANAQASRCSGHGVQVQAERAAWDFCSQNSIDLVAINPTYVLGPVTSSRADAQSVKYFIVRAALPASLSLPLTQRLPSVPTKYADDQNPFLVSRLASPSSHLLPSCHCNPEQARASSVTATPSTDAHEPPNQHRTHQVLALLLH